LRRPDKSVGCYLSNPVIDKNQQDYLAAFKRIDKEKENIE
jgi:hypothetical protein